MDKRILLALCIGSTMMLGACDHHVQEGLKPASATDVSADRGLVPAIIRQIVPKGGEAHRPARVLLL